MSLLDGLLSLAEDANNFPEFQSVFRAGHSLVNIYVSNALVQIQKYKVYETFLEFSRTFHKVNHNLFVAETVWFRNFWEKYKNNLIYFG